MSYYDVMKYDKSFYDPMKYVGLCLVMNERILT